MTGARFSSGSKSLFYAMLSLQVLNVLVAAFLNVVMLPLFGAVLDTVACYLMPKRAFVRFCFVSGVVMAAAFAFSPFLGSFLWSQLAISAGWMDFAYVGVLGLVALAGAFMGMAFGFVGYHLVKWLGWLSRLGGLRS